MTDHADLIRRLLEAADRQDRIAGYYSGTDVDPLPALLREAAKALGGE